MERTDDLDELDKMEATTSYATAQNVLPFGIRPKLKLSEIERLIRKHRVITPCPARQTLIKMCEDGTFETSSHGNAPGSLGWLVYEDSFWKWVRKFDEMAVAA